MSDCPPPKPWEVVQKYSLNERTGWRASTQFGWSDSLNGRSWLGRQRNLDFALVTPVKMLDFRIDRRQRVQPLHHIAAVKRRCMRRRRYLKRLIRHFLADLCTYLRARQTGQQQHRKQHDQRGESAPDTC